MRRNVLRILLVVILFLIVLGLVVTIGFIRPSVPEEWRSIKVGMSRNELIATIPDELNDMRELKGFDIATRTFNQWGFRRCWWQIMILYGDDDLVKEVVISFTDPSCGIYNTGWESLGP